jgi:hypothetical protein
MTSTKRLLTGLVLVVGLFPPLAAPASATPKAPNVHPWLLTLAEMPLGWSTAAAPAVGRTGCFALAVTLLSEHPGSSGTVAYEKGQAPLVQEMLVSWPAELAARHALKVVVANTASCHQFKDQGTTVTVEALNLGHYGSLSSAYQLTYTESGTVVAEDFVLALKGRAVMEFSYADEEDFLNTDLSQIQSLLATAMADVKG